MSGAVFRGVCAGAASWPLLSAALAIATGFIVTTGALGAIWPVPTHQAETLDKMPTASVAQPAPPPPLAVPAPAPPPIAVPAPAIPAAPVPPVAAAQPTVKPVARNRIPDPPEDDSDGTGDGVRRANYNPPSTISASRLRNSPQIMSVSAFNDSIKSGDIYAASLSDYERSQNTRVTGTPDQLAELDQEYQQTYADAVAAGGTTLTTPDGVTGVVVSSYIAQQYGYTAASPQMMQNIAVNRQNQAVQRQQQRMASLRQAGGMRGAGGFHNSSYGGGMRGGYGGGYGGMRGGFGGGFGGGMHGGGGRR